MNLVPRSDGLTTVETIGKYGGEGTRVEVQLGPDAGPIDLDWAHRAIIFSKGEYYRGKTSPWWYTSRDFHELCLAAKDMTVSDLVSQFESCASKVGTITAGFKAKQAIDVTLEEAKVLLDRMRNASVPVKPSRLGYCNIEELEWVLGHYARETGTFKLTSDREVAELPYVIEAWTRLDMSADISIQVNRTPITGEVNAYHSKTKLSLFGCGLKHSFEVGRRPPRVILSIITPFMPITTDGKSPDLTHLLNGIVRTVTKSINKAKRASPPKAIRNQKDIVLENLQEAIEKTGGGHRYHQRQLFYTMRDIVSKESGVELKYENFTKVITEHENAIGHDLLGMIRDDRGTLYHPHRHEQISLGTLMVESYEPPDWTFNKVLYIEKEGFFSVLQDERWPEKHDCALLTSKGQPTRAARDFIDGLRDTKEEITFYCIHDADAAGTIIYQALQDATKARPARKVKVVNLGLEPEEGLAMGLVPETFVSKDRRPVADYVSPRWAEWLQTHRIELNTMTTPQFLQWLDDKMEKFGQGKLIPPESVLEDELHEKVREKLEQDITDRILKEQDAEGQIDQAFENLRLVLDEKAKELPNYVVEDLTKEPYQSWRDPVLKTAKDIVDAQSKEATVD